MELYYLINYVILFFLFNLFVITVLCKHKDEPTSTSVIIKAILTPRERFPYYKLFGCVETPRADPTEMCS